MSRQVQIDFDLFLDLYEYFASKECPDTAATRAIQAELEDKFERLINREFFSRYKRASDPEEREAFRQAYLDRRCISSDFRSEKELPLTPPEEA